MTAADLSRRAALGALALFGAAAAARPGLAQRRPAAAPLSAQDKALVDQAIAHLQSMNSMKGRFVQIDARGRRSEGDIFLRRPGKVRFAYDAPASLLLVSNGSTVNIWDSKLKTFESYPLGMTPLGLFLGKEIRLDRGVQVTQVRRFADGFAITASDVKRETEGDITLTFGAQPVALREWTVTDAQGQKTRVILSDLQPASGLSNKLFELRDPRPRPGTAKR